MGRALKWVKRRPAAAALWCLGVVAAVVLLGLVQTSVARRAEQERLAKLQDVEKDRRMVERLEEVRMAQLEGFDLARADPGYAAAFRAYGMEVEGLTPQETAVRIQARPIKDQLVAALDFWARLKGAEDGQRLVEIARLADPDPWRDRFRAAWMQKDGEALKALAAEGEVAAALQPATLDLLATYLAQAGQLDGAVRLLQRAHQQHPSDLWINHNLAYYLARMEPPPWDEVIRFATAARALRPRSALVLNNLGRALKAKGRTDEAMAAYHEAIRLKPNFAMAHNNLGSLLCDQKQDYDAAIAACRKAIHFKHDYAEAHYNLGNALAAVGRTNEAIAAYQEVIRLKEDFAEAQYGLGVVLARERQLERAVVAFREAIRLKPDYAEALNNLGGSLHDKGQLEQAIEPLQKAIRLKPDYFDAHANLGNVLSKQGWLDGAIAAYQKAISINKDNALLHNTLGYTLAKQGRLDEAFAAYERAVHLKPDFALAYCNLGNLLCDQKQDYDAAVAAHRKAIHFQHDYAEAHYGLGVALARKGQLDQAIAAYQKAIHFQHDYAEAYSNLGAAQYQKGLWDEAIAAFLFEKGLWDEAIAAHRQALRLMSDNPLVHYNLGRALFEKGLWDEAITAYQAAVRLKPDYAKAHNKLGNLLSDQKRDYDAAIAAYQKAIHFRHDYAEAYHGLGLALAKKGQLDQAIAAWQKAIAFDPKDVKVHYNLGNVLWKKGQLDQAVAAFQEALRLKEDLPEVYCNLGHVLREQGRFAEALAALKRGHLLSSKNPHWPYPSARWVGDCERLIALDKRLPAVLEGTDRPGSATEHLEFAKLCLRYRQRPGAAADLYLRAFQAEPKLTDLPLGHRYDAACAAAQAGCGQGRDDPKPGEKERARWRQQALEWLRADLTLWSRHLDAANPKERATILHPLQRWQQDPALAGLRDAAALADLPQAEREACNKLWADVGQLLARALPK